MDIRVFKDAGELSRAVAGWISDYVLQVLEEQDRFTIALSGGSTPKKLHQLLAASPFKEEIPWQKMHFFWGDERDVPFSDERNNARMAFDTLFDFVPVVKKNIHVMNTETDPATAVAGYEQVLHNYFPDPTRTFDLVLLGMGDDGHTLSLFPGYDIVHESGKWVDRFYLEEQEMNRITLTAPVVNASSRIAFLVAGAGKAKALQQVIGGSFDPDTYPAQQINPVNGELYWFLDEAAAALLETG